MLKVRSIRVVALMFFIGLLASAGIAYSSGVFNTPNEQKVAGLPLSASLSEPIYLSDQPSPMKGWVTVQHARGSYHSSCIRPLNYTGFAPTCTNQTPITAYRRVGNQWVATSRMPGTHVYLYPFATDWSWTWTAQTGWLAMRDTNVVIGYRPIAVAT